MPVHAIDARAISPHFPGIGRYLRSLIHAMSRSLDRTKPWLSFTTVTFILRAAASIGQSHLTYRLSLTFLCPNSGRFRNC